MRRWKSRVRLNRFERKEGTRPIAHNKTDAGSKITDNKIYVKNRGKEKNGKGKSLGKPESKRRPLEPLRMPISITAMGNEAKARARLRDSGGSPPFFGRKEGESIKPIRSMWGNEEAHHLTM